MGRLPSSTGKSGTVGRQVGVKLVTFAFLAAIALAASAPRW